MTDNRPIDFDQARIDPAAVFDSPQDVVHHSALTQSQRREILERWKQDAEELAVASGEGMELQGKARSGTDEAALLEAVAEALRALDAD